MNPSEYPRSVETSLDNPPGFSVGIVIPVKNGLKFFKLCFHSVMSFADHPHTITVVDNQSNLKTKDYFRIQRINHPISVLRYDEEFNFAAEVNLGIRHAFQKSSVQFGLILNADCVVTPEFLSELVLPFSEDEKLGISGPLMNHAVGEQEDLGKRGRMWPAIRVSGACMIFRRRVFDQLGGFDEMFKGGGFEDWDFCTRAIKAGWQVAINGNAYVHHSWRGFRRDDAHLIAMKANEEMFYVKHPELARLRPAKVMPARAPYAFAAHP